HDVSWSAWAFNQYHLVQETTNYTPTFLKSPDEDACCGLGPSASCNFGIGTVLQQYLAALVTNVPTPTSFTSPTPIATSTATPAPTMTPLPTNTPAPLPTNTPIP